MSNIDQILKNSKAKEKPKRRFDFQVEAIYGAEPTWEGNENLLEDFNLQVQQALNWVNASFDHKDFKEQVLTYAENTNIPLSKFNSLADWRFVNAGKIAWLLNNGCPLTENWTNQLKKYIEELLKIVEDTVEIEPVVKFSIVEKRSIFKKTVVEDYMSSYNELIDSSIYENKDINCNSIYQHFSGKKVDEKIAKEIYDRLNHKVKKLNSELEALNSLENKEIEFDTIENFENYHNDIANNINQHVEIANQIGAYLGNKRAIKKSERKFGSKMEAQRASNAVANVAFKVHDKDLKITSINPAMIIGSKTLTTYNTQSERISVYIAEEGKTLEIKGTTIYNVDTIKSFQKQVKKPVKLIDIQKASLKRLSIILSYIRAKTHSVSTRINENTLIIQCYDSLYETE